MYVRRVKNVKIKVEYEFFVKKYGIYYSVLIELNYFDVIIFCVIDFMYNLFLGIVKKVFKLWVERDIFSKKKLEKVEFRLEEVNLFIDIGRIFIYIFGNYGVFFVVEGKNWIVIFFLYVFCGILLEEDYRCWEKFVIVCRILCKFFIFKEDIGKVDFLFLNFCKFVERLYGLSSIFCNMYLYCYLKECLFDFGFIYVYWCFLFECYNGIFGKLYINNKGIEI